METQEDAMNVAGAGDDVPALVAGATVIEGNSAKPAQADGDESIKAERQSPPAQDVDATLPVASDLRENGQTVQNPEDEYRDENPTVNGNSQNRISAYAKLEFEDGVYFMNTISVVIGRDVEIGREARRRHVKQQKAASSGEPVTPFGDDVRSGPRSVVSERGGIVSHTPRKRRRKSKTGSSVSEPAAAPVQLDDSPSFHEVIAGGAEVSLDDLLPDPYEEPLVAIHEPLQSDGSVSLSRGISRKHIKISYHYPKDCFQLTVLGRNGAFLDGQHYASSAIVALNHGSVIQVGGVTIKFHLPSEAIPNGDDQFSSSGHVSHAFEDSEGGNLEADDSDDLEDLPPEQRFNNSHLHHYYGSDFSEEGSEPTASIEDEAPTAPRVKLKLKQNASTYQRSREAGKHVAAKRPGKHSKLANGKPGKGRLSKFEQRKAKRAGRRKSHAHESPAMSDDADEEEDEADIEEDSQTERPTARGQTSSKKPAKSPAEPQGLAGSPTEGSSHLVNRETAVINGENGVYIPNLPMGVVIPARKKGPGRPPKDGLMSKREKALINKHLKEVEKAKKLGLDPSQVPALDLATTKPAKPRSESRDISSSAVPIAGSATPQVHGGDQTSVAEKASKPSKPEEPAQPEMKESDYTAEQLMKPQANYATMLFDILKEQGRMNLQQIYEIMERKFPYFKFKAGTSGWQSSVRHNLGQNDVFRKAEKDGKGYSWELNPDKSMEPPRKVKKQPTPPPHPAHGFNPYQQRHYPPVPPYQQHGQLTQQRPPIPQGLHLAQGANASAQGSGQASGNYNSSFPAALPNSASNGNGNSLSNSSGADAAQRAAQAPGSSQPGGRKEPIWTRETLVTTVYKIYGPRLGPSVDLKATCERAVDWFLRPGEMQAQKAQPPFGKELEILKALRDAHNAQQNNADVLANRPQGAGQPATSGTASGGPSPAPAASASPAPAVQQALNGQAAPQQSQSQQAGSSSLSRPATPQAPQPEPLTRPNSSQGVARDERSNTPTVDPPSAPPAEATPGRGVKRERRSSTARRDMDNKRSRRDL